MKIRPDLQLGKTISVNRTFSPTNRIKSVLKFSLGHEKVNPTSLDSLRFKDVGFWFTYTFLLPVNTLPS